VRVFAENDTSGEYLLSVVVTPKGDMDLDGQVDLGDVDGFVLALASPVQYEASYGLDPTTNGDMDGDGDLDFDDIDDFVAVVTGGSLGSDWNADSRVNGLDVEPFANVLLSGSFHVGADLNRDGAVNGLDVAPFVQAVLAGSAQLGVPAGGLEESDIVLAVAAILPTLDRPGDVYPESFHGRPFSSRSDDLGQERVLRKLHHRQDVRRTPGRVFAKPSQIGPRFDRDGRRSPREEMHYEAAGDWRAAVDLVLRDEADWSGQSGR
jgi:hypothetical protein